MGAAVAGWVLLVVVGVAHRLLPMFLLSHGASERPGRAAAGLLAAGVGLLLVAPPAAEADEDIVVLDVRGMEPPEPMVRTLAALETLPPGKTLLQINERVPPFLLPRLEQNGFSYEVREQSEGVVRVFIRRRDGRPTRFEPGRRSAASVPHDPISRSRAMPDTTRDPVQLDVRVIPPREKHPTIFQTFEALEPGEAFVLVNDHDPLPLRYQFEAERGTSSTGSIWSRVPRSGASASPSGSRMRLTLSSEAASDLPLAELLDACRRRWARRPGEPPLNPNRPQPRRAT